MTDCSSISSETEAPRRRVDFIDALRGYAILMMLQGHTVDVVLCESCRKPEHFAYFLWDRLRGLTAPTFFFAAGLIFAYLLLREEARAPGSNARLGKGLLRVVWLLVLGFLAQFHFYDLERILRGAPDRWEFLSSSHVLHSIALTLLLILGVFWLVRRGPRHLALLVWLGVGLLSFLLAGFIAPWSPSTFPWTWISLFTSRETAYFALFPWAGFGLAGAAFGGLLWVTRWHERGWFSGSLAGVGAILLLVCAPFGGEHGWLTFRLAAGIFLLGLVGLLCLRGWMPEFVLRAGRETLTLFLLHVVVLYGGLTGYGLHLLWPRELGAGPTLLLALSMVASFALLAWHLPTLRRWCPPLRWIR
ncbi:MAG: heparan-alpha-glucosaminide N-acetyltransferase domain-containing protein [Verrucomicrobiota bacterium]